MIEFTRKGEYEAPEFDEKFHEASLLNLDISKAMHFLDWKPVLDFEETVKFTVDGYMVNKNFYNARVDQIEAYCKIAENK